MGRGQRIEDLNDLPAHSQEMRPGMWRRDRLDLVGDPAGLERAHHLVVECDGTRLIKYRWLLLNDCDPEPSLAQEQRQRRPDRAVSDDHRIVMHDGPPALKTPSRLS